MKIFQKIDLIIETLIWASVDPQNEKHKADLVQCVELMKQLRSKIEG